jgi:hypothetical protein
LTGSDFVRNYATITSQQILISQFHNQYGGEDALVASPYAAVTGAADRNTQLAHATEPSKTTHPPPQPSPPQAGSFDSAVEEDANIAEAVAEAEADWIQSRSHLTKKAMIA